MADTIMVGSEVTLTDEARICLNEVTARELDEKVPLKVIGISDLATGTAVTLDGFNRYFAANLFKPATN